MRKGDDTAFPVLDRNATPNGTYQPGLTKREFYAAMAMQGFMATGWLPVWAPRSPPGVGDYTPENFAAAAVLVADALLEALNPKCHSEDPCK